MKARTCLSAMLFVLTASLSAGAAESPTGARQKAIIQTTRSGLQYGIWPARPASPAPTLVILASSMEETLESPYFRQSGNVLSQKGYLCVSIDLPCHGKDTREGEPSGLAGWRKRCEQGEDFVAETCRRLSAVLDELVSSGLTRADQIAVCGTSRGGFMALHFAAADARVRAVATFGQLTDMTMLREFQGVQPRELADRLALQHLTAKLAGRPVWIIIGDRDARVDTDLAIAFARGVTRESVKAGKDAQVELHVLPEPRGHSIPAGSADKAATWLGAALARPLIKSPLSSHHPTK